VRGELNEGETIAGNAAPIILGHGHPSGCPEPSGADREITRRLREAGELLGIRVLDHVITGNGTYFSFADTGWQ
jgi:DNA repair protein RadC